MQELFFLGEQDHTGTTTKPITMVLSTVELPKRLVVDAELPLKSIATVVAAALQGVDLSTRSYWWSTPAPTRNCAKNIRS